MDELSLGGRGARKAAGGKPGKRRLTWQGGLGLALALLGVVWPFAAGTLLDGLPYPVIVLLGGLGLAPLFLLFRRPAPAGDAASPKKPAGREGGGALSEKALFMDRLSRLLSLNIRDQRQTVVMYVGVDGFEQLHALGPAGANAALQELTDRLAETMRNADTITRMNKSELVVVLGGDVKDEDVVVVIARVQREFARSIPVPEGTATLRPYLGVACFPTDGVSGEILLQNAYLAMIQAREQRDPFHYYSPNLNRKALERLTVEARMLQGLERDEYFLNYQPKYDLLGKTAIGLEALVRWRQDGAVIMPDSFIPVAEHNGMIVKLGEWVLREACRQSVSWQGQGIRAVPVSVNVSNSQLRDPEFAERVEQVLAETGLEPGLLELEITENDLLCLSDDVTLKLLRLKSRGVSVAIDDFGTGYSSLATLKHLPIDRVKIDRSLVAEMLTDAKDAAVAEAIIAMASAMKLAVTAEGVENRKQFELLQRRGCTEFQGFFFSRPVEADQVAELLLAGPDAQEEPPEKGEAAWAAGNGADASGDAPAAEAAPRPAESAEYMRDVAQGVQPVSPQDTILVVLSRFQLDRDLKLLPVVSHGEVVGMVNRTVFFEEHIIGRQGYAVHINHAKKIKELMEPPGLVLDSELRIEDAATSLKPTVGDLRVDNICITTDGAYSGVIDVNRIFRAMTEIQLSLAKGANPLSGLPGNTSIERQISRRLEAGTPFDIAYIDIDNFKPFNDHYGFQKGDEVIKKLAEVIERAAAAALEPAEIFCGHIGGDDFIVITGPLGAESLCGKIAADFDRERQLFHGEFDFAACGYHAKNRKGEYERIPLIAISVGIVSTALTPVDSYASLASLSTEVKKAAKKLPGSSIVVEGGGEAACRAA